MREKRLEEFKIVRLLAEEKEVFSSRFFFWGFWAASLAFCRQVVHELKGELLLRLFLRSWRLACGFRLAIVNRGNEEENLFK